MGNRDVLEPDEARPRDETGKEPPPWRWFTIQLFRFGMRLLSLGWLFFRFLRWLADVLGL